MKKHTVWELQSLEGKKFHGFKNLAELEVYHFSNIYKKPERVTIVGIVKVCSFYPKLISLEDNETMFEEVSLDELLEVRYSF